METNKKITELKIFFRAKAKPLKNHYKVFLPSFIQARNLSFETHGNKKLQLEIKNGV